ncbi:MAG: AAA family ATPase [Legionella sp.]|uniref:hypothetical protein n=1 Tax=Legionella sp. TaxID=459 RepID=UPI00283E6802|nr:AAA family ATPase [Legionella sp.]
MQIKFHSVRIKNFLSYGNEWTELQLDSHNTSVIMGTNGAGKSTIVTDAICFALYKKAYKKLTKEQLPNNITKKKCVIELIFSIGSDVYKIIRGIKPDVFEIYKNEDLINQTSDVRDYQKDVLENQILRMNYTTFCQIVMLGSSSYTPFMELTTPKRREVIEELTDLQVFTGMTSVIKTKITDNDNQVRSIQNEKELVEEKIKLIKNHQAETQRSNDTLVEDKLDRISETEVQINIYTDDIGYYQENISKLLATIFDADNVDEKKIKYEGLISTLRNKRDILAKDIRFLDDHDNCPTCKQVIAVDFKNETISEKQKKHDELVDGIEKLRIEIAKLSTREQEINKVGKEISEIEREVFKKSMQIETWKTYIDDIKREISLIKKTKVIDVDENKIKDQENRLTFLTQEYNLLIENKNYLKSALTQLPIIKGKLLKKYMPIINKQINKYLASLEFYVNFTLDENFEETIKSSDRDKFTYYSFSEGERLRINLAILLAWRAITNMRNSISCSILILDEILDSSLDAAGVSDFIKILKNMDLGTNTFIISHKSEEVFDQFDRVIRVEKNRNFSRICEEAA